jgi:hypothetical protein
MLWWLFEDVFEELSEELNSSLNFHDKLISAGHQNN